MADLYLGIDIGGTKCAVVVGNRDGEILDKKAFPSGRNIPPEDILSKFIEICCEFKAKYEACGNTFKTIGISCGGPLDSKRGVIQAPPNLPLWDDIHIVEILGEKVGLPAFIQNDANACAVAEWKFGSGKGSENMIFLTFGTGMGAGIILDGKLYAGTNDMAGEVGHIRLTDDGPVGYNKKGSFEGYCSGGGIKNLAEIIISEELDAGRTPAICGSKDDFNKITAKYIFEEARKGDQIAQKVVDICAEKLGRGLAVLVDILNPQKIVIGSIYSRSEDMLREKMDKVLKEEALSYSYNVCEVVTASLGEQIGDIASLTVAIINDRA